MKAELFRVETTGWIGNEVVRSGLLTLWENGCADAELWDGRDATDISAECFSHWDDVQPVQFDTLFAPFLAKLKD